MNETMMNGFETMDAGMESITEPAIEETDNSKVYAAIGVGVIGLAAGLFVCRKKIARWNTNRKIESLKKAGYTVNKDEEQATVNESVKEEDVEVLDKNGKKVK